MKRFLILCSLTSLTTGIYAQQNYATPKHALMKLNAGIVTSKLAATKTFYMNNLGFGLSFENDFYILLHTPDHSAEISFLLPEHPSQHPLFHKSYQGQGIYLTLEVNDVDKVYKEIRDKGVPIKIEMRDEPWGDRHFAIEDPNGIAIDFVSYRPGDGQ